jgi:hypothetical protein
LLSEPLDNHGWEWRYYIRDPDGYLIEVGQYTQVALDRFKNYVGRMPSGFTPIQSRYRKHARAQAPQFVDLVCGPT